MAQQPFEALVIGAADMIQFHNGKWRFLAGLVGISLGLGASLAGNLSLAAMKIDHAAKEDCATLKYPTSYFQSEGECRSTRGGSEWWEFGLLALAAASPALVLVPIAFGLKVPKPKLVRVFDERPQEIVWIYCSRRVKAQSERVVGWVVQLGLTSGGTASLDVRSQAEGDQVTSLLSAALPQATAGWSKERSDQFHRDPKSLRRG